VEGEEKWNKMEERRWTTEDGRGKKSANGKTDVHRREKEKQKKRERILYTVKKKGKLEGRERKGESEGK
jgi:hypothetical protein